MQSSERNAIHWFRKGLRIHDNPAFLEAVENSKHCWPIFILDPWFVKNMRVGPNRWRFLAQSLQDLDNSLKKFNSRLFVIRGKPVEVFSEIVKKWQIKLLTFEMDTEPYARHRDEEVKQLMESLNVEVRGFVSNTLYNPEKIIEYNGKVPLSMQTFLNTVDKIGLPPKPVPSEQKLLEILSSKGKMTPIAESHDYVFNVPTLQELGVNVDELGPCLYPGGESEALLRLKRSLSNEMYVCKFAKPDTSPNSIEPSTTVLSPYVKFGCLSARTFYYKLLEIYRKSKNGYTKPPVSLHGQLFWREFFYTVGSTTPHFDQMVDNPVCTQVPWNDNKDFLEAWEYAKTGYPFIDAIMTQLRQEGWVHHLARHAVACFLTRGDLWISWEQGMKVFEELLLDADWSLNAGNWMWLSASAFFHQFFRVYSPVAFGKKTDKNGAYIRKYVPVLKKFPPEYIYEPWKAPRKLQEQLGCIIGQDYPARIVDHDQMRPINIGRMAAAYKAKRESGCEESQNKTKDSSPKKKSSPKKSSLVKPESSKRSSTSDNKITKFFKSK